MTTLTHRSQSTIVGEPEVVEDASTAETSPPPGSISRPPSPRCSRSRSQDGSIPKPADHAAARELVATDHRRHPRTRTGLPARRRLPRGARRRLRPLGRRRLRRPRLLRLARRLPAAAAPRRRLRHLVVFPMYTQNGSPDRHVEALLVEVIWPEFIAELEAGDYSNKLFVLAAPRRLHARATTPTRRCCSPRRSRCARSRRSPGARSSQTARRPATAASCARPPRSRKLELPADAARLLDDQAADRGDLRDVGPHPRPHPHARRPAVRPVHDQAADAVLPLLARGAALRPDRVPRVRRGMERDEDDRRARPAMQRRCSCSTR